MTPTSRLAPRAKRRGQLTIGILGLLVSLGYGSQALTLPMGRPNAPGAGLVPVAVTVLMVVASLGVILEASVTSGSRQALDLPTGPDLTRLLGTASCIVGYVVLLPILGFLLTSTIAAIALVRLLSSDSWLRTLVTGVLLSASTYMLFVWILKVPLPRGILQ